MFRPRFSPLALFVSLLLNVCAVAQNDASYSPDAAAPQIDARATVPGSSVPRLVKFSGTLRDGEGNAVNGARYVSFSLYAEQSSTVPLWTETQKVVADENGRYTVTLGATLKGGIPINMFASGEARWLETATVSDAGKDLAAQRLMLVSVPFALKAEDADKLGGRAATDFALSSELEKQVAAAVADQLAKTQSKAGQGDQAYYAPDKPIGTTVQDIAPNGAARFQDNSLVEVVLVQQNGSGFGLNAVSINGSAIHASSLGVGAGNATILAQATSSTGSPVAVQGESFGATGIGVQGIATGASAANVGVRGESSGPSGRGVEGMATNSTGFTFGMLGAVTSPNGVGVRGEANGSSGGTGVVGIATSTSGTATGVQGEVSSSSGVAGLFRSNSSGGKVLLGQGPGTTDVFTVDANGNVTANGTLTATGGLTTTGTLSVGSVSVPSASSASGLVKATNSGAGAAVEGTSTAANTGVYGKAIGGGGTGVRGEASSATGIAGVFNNTAGGQILSGQNNGTEVFNVSGSSAAIVSALQTAVGVPNPAPATPVPSAIFGHSSTAIDSAVGVSGQSDSPNGAGVYGYNTSTAAGQDAQGVIGVSVAPNGIGVGGINDTTGATAAGIGVSGESKGDVGIGVYGNASSATTLLSNPSLFTVGVWGDTSSESGQGVRGVASSTVPGASAVGVSGVSFSDSGFGVNGRATSATGPTIGVRGRADSINGVGVQGVALAATGPTRGVKGVTNSGDNSNAVGVEGLATASTGITIGVNGVINSPDGAAVRGQASATSGTARAMEALNNSTQGTALNAFELATSGNTIGIRADVNSPSGVALKLNATAGGGQLISAFGDGGSQRFSVSSAGDVSATSFSGSGAGLTGVVASNATSLGGVAAANYARVDVATNQSLSGSLTLPVLALPNTTSSTSGVINIGGSRFLHNFGSQNTFTGINAGNFSMSGCCNAGFGIFSLGSNTTGAANAGLGYGTLQANTVGGGNSAVGGNAMFGNTTGNNNTGTGASALQNNTTGNFNTAVGYASGVTANTANANISGSNNTFVGSQAGPGTSTQLTNATAIGANALVSQSNSLVLGDSNVRVGIGTTVPGARLDISGGGIRLDNNQNIAGNSFNSIGYLSFAKTGTANEFILGDGNHSRMELVTGGTAGAPSIVIANGGNVGVGTSSPSSKLQVSGTVTATAFNGDGSGLTGIVASDTSSLGGVLAASYARRDQVNNFTNTQTVTGSIGINTASPEDVLDITNTAGDKILIGGTGPTIRNKCTSGACGTNFNGGAFVMQGGYDPNSGGGIVLEGSTRADAQNRAIIFLNNGLEVGRFHGNGNLGIANTAPTEKLDVTGNILASGTITASGGFSGSGAGLTGVSASTLAAGTYSNAFTFSNASNSFTGSLTGTASDASALGGVVAANYARLDVANSFNGNQTITGGSLGIGASSPLATLDVASTGGDHILIGTDILRFSCGSACVLGPNAGGLIFQGGADPGAGGMIFVGGSTRGDGLVNGIQFLQNNVEVGRFNNGGNFGIGNTAPAEKLDVTGNIKASGSVTAASFSGSGAGLTGVTAGSVSFANVTSGTNTTTLTLGLGGSLKLNSGAIQDQSSATLLDGAGNLANISSVSVNGTSTFSGTSSSVPAVTVNAAASQPGLRVNGVSGQPAIFAVATSPSPSISTSGGIVINEKDVVPNVFPVDISSDISALTYGTAGGATMGRHLRFTTVGGSGANAGANVVWEMGSDLNGDFFILKPSTTSQALVLNKTSGNLNVALGSLQTAGVTRIDNSGNAAFGTVSATSYTGDGSALTGVVASNATSLGGVAAANYARLDVATNQTLTGSLTLPVLALPATTSSTVGVLNLNSASFMHAFGTFNTFLGSSAGNFTLTGNRNTGVGANALQSLTNGFANTAIGESALSLNTSGNNNTATGRFALVANTTGSSNTAAGQNALGANSTGFNNTGEGYQALGSNGTGFNNTALGVQAGYTATPANANTSGSNNTFLGFQAGPGSATQLTNAAAIGSGALVTQNDSMILGNSSVKVGIGNTAPAEKLDVTGNIKASGSVTAGSFSGDGSALTGITSANASTLGGLSSDTAATPSTIVARSASGDIFASTFHGSGGGLSSIPNAALANADTTAVANSVVLRDASGDVFASSFHGDGSALTGIVASTASGLALPTTTSSSVGTITSNSSPFIHRFGTGNSFFGLNAGNFSLTNVQNTGVGEGSLAGLTTGAENTGIGYAALAVVAGGNDNAAFGHKALQNLTSGSFNTAVGQGALQVATTTTDNTAVGWNSMNQTSTGIQNTAVGKDTMSSNTIGFENVAMGVNGLLSNTSGFENTGIGTNALRGNTTGQDNTALGRAAGYTATPANANTTGSNNTFLGAYSGPGVASQLSNATAIGANALVNTSNSMVLGNGVNVGIGTSGPTEKLHVVGNILATGTITASSISGSGSSLSNVAAVVGSFTVAQPALTAISTTTLFTPTAAGLYRAACYMVNTASGTGPNGVATIHWTDDSGTAQSQTCASFSLGSLGEFVSGSVIVQSGASAVTFDVTSNSVNYKVYISLEKLI